MSRWVLITEVEVTGQCFLQPEKMPLELLVSIQSLSCPLKISIILIHFLQEMFNGYNWQTRILEVRQDRLPPSDLDISTLPHPHPLTSSSSTAPFFFGKSLSSYGSLPNLAKTHTLDLDDFQLQSAERNRNPSTVTTRNLFVGNVSQDKSFV